MREIILKGRWRRHSWPGETICHLICLAGDVAEVHRELRDEEKLSLGSLGPGGS